MSFGLNNGRVGAGDGESICVNMTGDSLDACSPPPNWVWTVAGLSESEQSTYSALLGDFFFFFAAWLPVPLPVPSLF